MTSLTPYAPTNLSVLQADQKLRPPEMQASPAVSECLPSPSPAVSVYAAPALKPYTHLFQLTWQASAAKPSP